MVKNRIKLICPNCGKEFEIIKSRLNLSQVHYCSLKCLSRYTAKQRSKKLQKREYPFKCGVCLQCGKDIMARNGSFVKSNRKFCSHSCRTTYNNKINNPMNSLETRKKVGIMNKGKTHIVSKETCEKYRLANLGEKSHFWKGGLTEKNRLERNSAKVKKWIKEIFERDNYTCQECGKRSVYLSAHHIKSWSKYPKLRYCLSNGITLCQECHKKTPNFAYKLQFQND